MLAPNIFFKCIVPLLLFIVYVESERLPADIKAQLDYKKKQRKIAEQKALLQTGGKVIRISPPPMLYFPGYKFEGVEYEDTNIHPQERWVTIDPAIAQDNDTLRIWDNEIKRHRCIYDYLRCIRMQPYIHWVCAMMVRKMPSNENFINICEMEYTNCLLGFKKYFYNGDGYKCRFIYVREHRSWQERLWTDATR